jgi:Ca-activated chloride channel homolog
VIRIVSTLVACTAAALISWRGIAASQTQPRAEQIVIEEPTADRYVAGPTTFRAAVTPSTAAVTRVEFYVDGVRVCQAERDPFECTWDGGPTVRARIVRAVAILPSGERLATSLRTSDIPGFTDSSSVETVLVPFVATDRSGRFVKGLQRTAVRVLEDNEPQTISYFESEEVPLEMVMAIDISGSMAPASGQLRQALKAFLAAFRPSDRVTLVAFNHQVYVLLRQSTDRAALAATVDSLVFAGGTALYDATLASLDLLGSEVQRRAVLVFTDGDDQGSLATAEPVERRLRASDAVAYFVTLETNASATGRRAVKALADVSGGRVMSIDRINQLGGALESVRDELQNQYLVGYTPTKTAKDGSYRRIRISLAQQGHTIRARQGYLANPR